MSGRFHKVLEKLNIDGRDAAVLFASLLVAFSIWLVHGLSLRYSVVVSVPVVAESNIDGYSRQSSGSSIVTARCRASGYYLLGLNHQKNQKPKEVYINPSDLHHQDGEIFYISSAELVNYVEGIFLEDVQIEAFMTEKVQFRFARENCKKVPVNILHVISFKPQYMATGTMTVAPDSVLVYGDPIHLGNIESISTSVISLSNLDSDAVGVTKLEVPAGIRLSDIEVSYSMGVSRYVEVKSTETVAVRNVPAGRELSVYPSSAEVVLKCSFPLGSNPSESVSLYVDYADFAKSINGRCVARVGGLPASVLDYSVEPEVFECMENRVK